MSFQILGTGASVPEYILTNDELSRRVDTSDEWIRSRTGIVTRRICTTETLRDLASRAAMQAMSEADAQPGDLDLILCATMQGDTITPSLACMVQREIGATCPAMDINAACTGFLYALDVAAGYYARGRVRHVLVIGAEQMSKYVDWDDRATCVLFGDGAGAVVLGPGEHLLASSLAAQGNDEHLYIPGTASTFSGTQTPAQKQALHMNGQEIYRFAVQAMCGEITTALKEAGLSLAQVRYVLVHQANRRILEAAGCRLGIEPAKLPISLDRYGNTSAASIPLMLHDLNVEGRLDRGDILVLCAFGGGLTVGTSVIRW